MILSAVLPTPDTSTSFEPSKVCRQRLGPKGAMMSRDFSVVCRDDAQALALQRMCVEQNFTCALTFLQMLTMFHADAVMHDFAPICILIFSSLCKLLPYL